MVVAPDLAEQLLAGEDLAGTFEVERDDGQLEVEIKAEIAPAEPGVHDLGAAGSVDLGLDGRRLVLRDVVVADGWQLEIDDESAEEVELSLRSGAERWDFEAERDDGVLDVQIDYQVRGAPTP